MIINASIKNARTVILPQNCYPVDLFFKDEGGLANHPLSCHPQGVFGRRESERKGEKMREKEKSGKTGALHAKFSNEPKVVFDYNVGAYILPQLRKLQKKPKSKAIIMDKFGRKPKSDKK